MTGNSVTFLIVGVVLSALTVWGFVTGDMPTKFFYGDRAKHPAWFWASSAINSALALIAFYCAWLER
jgi:hypothetical protein